MPEQTQRYENHAHRPVPTILAGLLSIAALISFVLAMFGRSTTLLGGVLLTLAVFVLVSISRLYIVTLQDRIIRLEMRLRAAETLPPDARAKLARLSTKQIVALRFASDAELATLIDRALTESLAPDQIKKAVKTWTPDLHRT